MRRWTPFAFAVTFAWVAAATEWFVDDVTGRDDADGRSPESAWRSLGKVNAAELAPGDEVRFRSGGIWRGQLRPQSGSLGRSITYGSYGKGPKPVLMGSVSAVGAAAWQEVAPGLWRSTVVGLVRDVGQVVCADRRTWGVKKFSRDELKAPLDYWYDENDHSVLLRSDVNPGLSFSSLELALSRHIIDETRCHDVVYDGLALRYGAAHGIGGATVSNVVVRACDISWIGGGLQRWVLDGKSGRRHPCRWGNGVEFGSNCRNALIERCRIWEIYDAAVTCQSGAVDDPDENVVFRDNVLWHAEYSFEFWNVNPRSRSSGIVFEHNTCVGAGFGWGHRQRPNPNGTHLMFFQNRALAENVVVRNNVFCRASERAVTLVNDWLAPPGSSEGLRLERNLYWVDGENVFEGNAKGQKGLCFGPYGFADYVARLGIDRDSVCARPEFIDEESHDYRLRPGSVGSSMATDRSPVGARFVDDCRRTEK